MKKQIKELPIITTNQIAQKCSKAYNLGRLSALKEEIEFLKAMQKWRSWNKMSIFARENINNQLRILKEKSEVKSG